MGKKGKQKKEKREKREKREKETLSTKSKRTSLDHHLSTVRFRSLSLFNSPLPLSSFPISTLDSPTFSSAYLGFVRIYSTTTSRAYKITTRVGPIPSKSSKLAGSTSNKFSFAYPLLGPLYWVCGGSEKPP